MKKNIVKDLETYIQDYIKEIVHLVRALIGGILLNIAWRILDHRARLLFMHQVAKKAGLL